MMTKTRIELGVWHLLGGTEYGLLSTSGMEVGYYDRLEDDSRSYLRQDFPKSSGREQSLNF